MTDHVLETTALRKEYHGRRRRTVVAVDDLDLAVSGGGVHGFLGPNGSGKTTTIRMLLGLAGATSGRMAVLGEEVPRGLPKVVGRVGAVVEQPRFLPGFTGHRNLELLARTVRASKGRVDDVLERVGLAERADDRYHGYSLGMRQRLAIAAALLKSPELLILDEPTNGLDPAGIRDIRELVRHLGSSGVTVLLSSHILAEVQQVCDSMSIIGAGRLLASGTVDQLVGRDHSGTVRVGVADPGAAAAVLTAAGLRVRRDGERLYVDGAEDPSQVTRLLAADGLYVHELGQEQPDLEAVFLRLTGEAARDEGMPS